jgi:hypothetical protein
MATKTILLTGLASGATELGVQSWLDNLGIAARVGVFHEEDTSNPYALVQMDISDAAAAALVSRLNHYWHEGAMVSAWLLHH